MLINQKKYRVKWKRGMAEALMRSIDTCVLHHSVFEDYELSLLLQTVAEVSHLIERQLLPGVVQVKFSLTKAQLMGLGAFQSVFLSSPTSYEGTMVRQLLAGHKV